MHLIFGTDKLRQLCNDDRVAIRELGRDCAKLLRRRLDDLAAAPSLATMRTLPGACHELKADRAGELAVRLSGGARLVFVPAHEPRPTKLDGGLDWNAVTRIRVTFVGDYHD